MSDTPEDGNSPALGEVESSPVPQRRDMMPEEPGYYWMRRPEENWKVVRVEEPETPCADLLLRDFENGLSWLRDVLVSDCEWVGPIQKPITEGEGVVQEGQ